MANLPSHRSYEHGVSGWPEDIEDKISRLEQMVEPLDKKGGQAATACPQTYR